MAVPDCLLCVCLIMRALTGWSHFSAGIIGVVVALVICINPAFLWLSLISTKASLSWDLLRLLTTA